MRSAADGCVEKNTSTADGLRPLCRRVSVLHEGKLIAEGSVEEFANHAFVLEAYLGR